jgi:hypothetical protein
MGFDGRTVTAGNAADIAHWCGGKLVEEEDALDPTKKYAGINVPCGTEVRRASEGDTVITDGTRFHVVKKGAKFND